MLQTSQTVLWPAEDDALTESAPPPQKAGDDAFTESAPPPQKAGDADPGDISSESDEEDASNSTIPEKRARQLWTSVEKGEILKYFKEYLECKTTPSSVKVRKAKKKSQKKGGQLYKRRDDLIIKKISAINHK